MQCRLPINWRAPYAWLLCSVDQLQNSPMCTCSYGHCGCGGSSCAALDAGQHQLLMIIVISTAELPDCPEFACIYSSMAIRPPTHAPLSSLHNAVCTIMSYPSKKCPWLSGYPAASPVLTSFAASAYPWTRPIQVPIQDALTPGSACAAASSSSFNAITRAWPGQCDHTCLARSMRPHVPGWVNVSTRAWLDQGSGHDHAAQGVTLSALTWFTQAQPSVGPVLDADRACLCEPCHGCQSNMIKKQESNHRHPASTCTTHGVPPWHPLCPCHTLACVLRPRNPGTAPRTLQAQMQTPCPNPSPNPRHCPCPCP